jgi:hypothetical protein
MNSPLTRSFLFSFLPLCCSDWINSVHKFTDSIFCHLHLLSPPSECFILVTVFFSYTIYIGFFLWLTILCYGFLFLFVSREFVFVKAFLVMEESQFLSGNSNMLVSFDCLLSFKVWPYLGPFCYYDKRFWFLFKFCRLVYSYSV